MILEMRESLEKLASDIKTVDSSYTSAKARDYISFSDDSFGFTDRIGLAPSLSGGALVIIAAFVFSFLRRLLSGKKEKEL